MWHNLWKSKRFREKQAKAVSRSSRKLWRSKAHRRKMSDVAKRVQRRNWKDPSYRSRMSRLMSQRSRAAWRSGKMLNMGRYNRRKTSRIMKKRWKDPKFREKMSRTSTMQKLWEKGNFREAHKKGTIERLKTQNRNGLASKAGEARGKQIQKQWERPTREMRLQVSKAGLISAESHSGVRFGPSGSQVSLFRRLCRSGISGLKLEHRVNRYSIDIAHLPTKTAVECDGRHWHRNHTGRDKVRDKFLRKLGWKTLRFKIDSQKEARLLDISSLIRRLS